MSCDSCGRECTAACGTRQFRACCFNYLRKRSGQSPTPSDRLNELDPGLRLELWLARGGAAPPTYLRPVFDRNIVERNIVDHNIGQDSHHKINVDNEDYQDSRIRSDQI